MPRPGKNKWRQVPAALAAFAAVAIVAIAAVGCSNQRNTPLSRAYQRLTSHYNVYFNGCEAFDSGIETIRKGTRNDYSHVLPLYEFDNAKTAKSATADMQTALKKCHKLVQLHSITVKPKSDGALSDEEKRFRAKEEFNPYVPEGYLLMGKANAVMHEDQEAMKYFDYLGRKHEGERPAYEAKIWKAIVCTRLGQYHSAIAALKAYDMDGVAPTELYADYRAAYANIFLEQGDYAQAIPHLEQAVAEVKDRHSRRRYKYILAQLYRQVGDKAKAAPLFLELSKQLQDYDMAFAAKLDLATVASTPEELATAEKTLAKMAKDPKNEEQLDQVYYSIGHLALGKGDKGAAIDAFGTSVRKSVSNDNQKGLSFLALADIYQGEPRYVEASESLDSAAILLDDANDRKAEAKERAATLAPLAAELRTVRDNDSLLLLARMDPKERNERLDQMVRDHNDRVDAELEAKEAAAMGDMSQSEFYQIQHQGMGSSQGSSWYFYNANLVNAGKSTFRNRWGNRKNEDNWRRSDKSSAASLEDLSDPAKADSIAQAEESKLREEMASEQGKKITREQLLAQLPLTPEKQAQNEAQTAKAMLRAAQILYDDIHDYRLCEEILDDYIRRFGNGSDELYDALALQHFTQKRNGNAAGMNATDRLIASKFPDSPLAKSIADGSYLQQHNDQLAGADRLYAEAYESYLSADFNTAIAKATQGIADTENRANVRQNHLLVRALSYAKQGNATAFRADLVQIGKEHPGTPQDSLAKIYLAKLDGGLVPRVHEPYQSPLASSATPAQQQQAQQLQYAYEPDSAHVIVCFVDNGRRRDAQFMVADYNFTNFLLRDFDIAMRRLPQGVEAIVISPFQSRRDAESYFFTLREQKFWKELSSDPIPRIYLMSLSNLRLLAVTGPDEAFMEFLRQHYTL